MDAATRISGGSEDDCGRAVYIDGRNAARPAWVGESVAAVDSRWPSTEGLRLSRQDDVEDVAATISEPVLTVPDVDGTRPDQCPQHGPALAVRSRPAPRTLNGKVNLGLRRAAPVGHFLLDPS